MRKEHMIERQGRQFVLYAGLLDEAHAKGLRSIRTQVVQTPDDSNGHTTIVHAAVEMDGGRVFQGIGDANPHNVGRNIAPHAVRMAETRAKARALRDALNIGSLALEEVADLDDLDAPPPQQRPAPRQDRGPLPPPAPAPRGSVAAGPGGQATGAQLAAVRKLAADRLHLTDDDLAAHVRKLHGCALTDLTAEQAGALIRELQASPTTANGASA